MIASTVVSLIAVNSPVGTAYVSWWHVGIGGLSIEHWINDALMALFFLLIGLELERELYNGELSSVRDALLPVFAAVGGIVAPVVIYLSLNAGTSTQAGFGIPMATDIAFVLGVLALLGSRIPASLKVFVVAFAVIDDLGAIVAIAAFYTADISVDYLVAALAVWGLLCVLNWRLRVIALTPYLLGGALVWFFMLKSGVHATLAGVLLAFAIPFTSKEEDAGSPSHRLENFLQKPVAFVVLPLFALANTAIPISGDSLHYLTSWNSLGIAAGLIIGKFLGVTVFCFIAVLSGLCVLPSDLNWRHISGAGMLGGIGFTMSIFITNLAFSGSSVVIDASKLTVLIASAVAGLIGFLWLLTAGRPAAREDLQ